MSGVTAAVDEMEPTDQRVGGGPELLQHHVHRKDLNHMNGRLHKILCPLTVSCGLTVLFRSTNLIQKLLVTFLYPIMVNFALIGFL